MPEWALAAALVALNALLYAALHRRARRRHRPAQVPRPVPVPAPLRLYRHDPTASPRPKETAMAPSFPHPLDRRRAR